jgi:hypothetical protein
MPTNINTIQQYHQDRSGSRPGECVNCHLTIIAKISASPKALAPIKTESPIVVIALAKHHPVR